jgi:predicted nuclease of restriction endonuclease-like (RecB) superfamily
LVAQHLYLFDKTKTLDEYLWHAAQTIENGWPLSSLEYHIETKTYSRQALAEKASNYKTMLPSPFSELAADALKNPYVGGVRINALDVIV